VSASGRPSDAASRPCPVCAGAESESVLRLAAVVVHCNLLWRSRQEAIRAPRADVDLAVCPSCGHLFNRAFDPTLMRYGEEYENALGFSDTFRRYASSLADTLVERNALHGKTIVELGCGDGAFLELLCERGGNVGFGFDPGAPRQRTTLAAGGGVTLIRGSWPEADPAGRVDFVCCRHVLEHLDSPLRFLADVHDALDATGAAATYFEVPNGLFMLRELLGWDVLYEHFSYFTPSSLVRLFESASFAVAAVQEDFGGHFLGIETAPGRAAGESVPSAGPGEPGSMGAAAVLAAARDFGDRWRSHRERLRTDLERARSAGRRTVVWGAGSKGVMFLNALGEAGAIEYAVDLNPRKRGMFVAGCGQRIVEPAFLCDYRPDTVLVMNANYKGEITATLAELGVACEIVAV
jgi:SAM-dependent methyltransferase